MRAFAMLSARILYSLLTVGVTAAPAAAQFDTAQVSGVVRDATGAVLPGVDVVLLADGTGLERRTALVPLLRHARRRYRKRNGERAARPLRRLHRVRQQAADKLHRHWLRPALAASRRLDTKDTKSPRVEPARGRCCVGAKNPLDSHFHLRSACLPPGSGQATGTTFIRRW